MYGAITKRNKPVSSTRWTGKWSNGIPTPTTDAYIDTDYTTVTGSFACRNLIITASAVLTIPENTYVKVLKDINQTPTSHIIVKACGELMLLNPDADVTTARLTAEATFKNLQRLDYAFISSPISSVPVKRLSPGTVDNRFYKYSEADNFFDYIVNPSVKLCISGEGYHIRTPANHPNLPTNFNITIDTFLGGNLNSGKISISTTRDKSGFNHLGNPYTSRISLKKFFEANKDIIESYVYRWEKTNGAQGYSYNTYNGHTNNIEKKDINILPFQSFIIRIKESINNSTVIFTPDMMIYNNDLSLPNRFYINIFQANVNFPIGGISYDNKLYKSKFSNTKNVTDTISLIKNENFVIYQEQDFNINKILNLKFLVTVQSTYKLSLKDTSGLFSQIPSILLYDSVTAITHNLKQSDYTFTSEAGTFTERFSIKFQ